MQNLLNTTQSVKPRMRETNKPMVAVKKSEITLMNPLPNDITPGQKETS